MIVLDLSILNQKGTPMFNSDLTANRPAAGIVGRIFIAIDSPFGIFRDTGSAWDQISAGGSGGITGLGAATQVAFWNGASAITGSNNLFWDSTNNYLGISTNTPTTALDVHHSTNSGAIFNQTTATNNNTINFQTSGAGRWRIGNFYTAGADDFGIFDVVGSLQQFTIVKTTGQTFIGAKTTASGRLVINSATSDAHLQIIGANSPSIRIDNAGSGGTQRFAIGNATATNNFIQGSAAGDFCITTASAGALLFGMWQSIDASEVMRITTANNLLVGLSVDGGQKLQILGSVKFNGGINDFESNSSTNYCLKLRNINANSYGLFIQSAATPNSGFPLINITDSTAATSYFRVDSGTGNVGINTSPGTQKLYLNGSFRIDGQTAGTSGIASGQFLIINCDGTTYKIALFNN